MTLEGKPILTTSRRTLLQGTAWAAPAVLATAAIPAYAASTPSVVAHGSTTEITLENTVSGASGRVSGSAVSSTDPAGFRLYQTSGTATTATISALTYYIAFPKNQGWTVDMVKHNFDLVDTAWTAFGLASDASIATADGQVLTAADYTFYSVSYSAPPITNYAVGGQADSLPVDRSTINADIAITSGDPAAVAGIYAGYVATYAVDGGSAATASTVSPAAISVR